MTREHLALAMALETPFFVVVTKIDLTCEEEAVLARVQAVLTSAACRRVSNLICVRRRNYSNKTELPPPIVSVR